MTYINMANICMADDIADGLKVYFNSDLRSVLCGKQRDQLLARLEQQVEWGGFMKLEDDQ